jgi:hypothetical protein
MSLFVPASPRAAQRLQRSHAFLDRTIERLTRLAVWWFVVASIFVAVTG